MVLVEADAVVAQAVELLPRVEMLGVSAHRHVGLEMLLAERIGQLGALLDMVEVLAVGEQVEDEDFHGPRLAPQRPTYKGGDRAMPASGRQLSV